MKNTVLQEAYPATFGENIHGQTWGQELHQRQSKNNKTYIGGTYILLEACPNVYPWLFVLVGFEGTEPRVSSASRLPLYVYRHLHRFVNVRRYATLTFGGQSFNLLLMLHYFTDLPNSNCYHVQAHVLTKYVRIGLKFPRRECWWHLWMSQESFCTRSFWVGEIFFLGRKFLGHYIVYSWPRHNAGCAFFSFAKNPLPHEFRLITNRMVFSLTYAAALIPLGIQHEIRLAVVFCLQELGLSPELFIIQCSDRTSVGKAIHCMQKLTRKLSALQLQVFQKQVNVTASLPITRYYCPPHLPMITAAPTVHIGSYWVHWLGIVPTQRNRSQAVRQMENRGTSWAQVMI